MRATWKAMRCLMNPAPDTANDTSVKPLGPPEWLMIAIAELSTLSATIPNASGGTPASAMGR